jgi:hypothetical protein
MEKEPIIAALNGALEAMRGIAITGDDEIDLAITLHYAEREPTGLWLPNGSRLSCGRLARQGIGR